MLHIGNQLVKLCSVINLTGVITLLGLHYNNIFFPSIAVADEIFGMR